MLITSDLIRGSTDTIILNCLSVQERYGYEINKLIQFKTSNKYKLNESTLYCAFRRLKEDLIVSSWGNEAVGARRRYYSITPLGKKVLMEYRENWENAIIIIDKLINYIS